MRFVCDRTALPSLQDLVLGLNFRTDGDSRGRRAEPISKANAAPKYAEPVNLKNYLNPFEPFEPLNRQPQ